MSSPQETIFVNRVCHPDLGDVEEIAQRYGATTQRTNDVVVITNLNGKRIEILDALAKSRVNPYNPVS